jgi:putative colanic acid biosynthesis acetyltransferase WcaF
MNKQETPYDSPWSVRKRMALLVWEYVWAIFCLWTPKPFNPWRLFILRLFGAKIMGTPFVHQRARIQIPWNLTLHHRACLGDRANAYTLGEIEIHEAATVAQEAYLCTGTHDIRNPSFQLITKKIEVGKNAFIGARAFIMPGVVIGENAVIGAGSVVMKDVRIDGIAVGNPAKVIADRNQ